MPDLPSPIHGSVTDYVSAFLVLYCFYLCDRAKTPGRATFWAINALVGTVLICADVLL
jgi:hypothetical protein